MTPGPWGHDEVDRRAISIVGLENAMIEPPNDNLDHYALGFYAPGKNISREACPYAEGMEAYDQWLAGYDAAVRGEKLEDRSDS